jgi:hypothetical protein
MWVFLRLTSDALDHTPERGVSCDIFSRVPGTLFRASELIEVMGTEDKYPDAGLRDKCNSWVTFAGDGVRPPTGVTLRGGQLAGYLYVDRLHGFMLRVHSELQTRPGETPSPCQVFADLEWDLRYEDIRALTLQELTASQCQKMGLPLQPFVLWPHFGSDIEHCRKHQSLDRFRLPGYPDLVRAWVRVGECLQGEQVLVRLEREAFPSVFECTVVKPPTKTDSFRSGDLITAVEFEWHGQTALYCVWDLEGRAEEGRIRPGEEQE